jgi:UDP:flavonoid glycosyltransferase YjiC (YdhE family)
MLALTYRWPVSTIAITSLALPGHLGPAVRLGTTLAGQGHRVLAFAPPSYRNQIESQGIRYTALEVAHGPVRGPVEFAADLAAGAENHAGELIEQLFEENVDLVIHDSLAPLGPDHAPGLVGRTQPRPRPRPR